MSKETDLIVEAKKRFERARDYYASARALAVEDTKFVMGDSDNGWQWPDQVAKGRKADQRVCLTVNMTAQHCNQIINNIRQNRPAVKVSPADNGADKETANILGGLIRNIQVSSGSDEAHDTAAEHAVYGGEGYWRILTEYESEVSFNQVIRIVACPNPGLVYIDPDCKQADKSDARWGFIFEDISKEQAKREHPGIDPQSWGDIDNAWTKEDTCRRAEYFYCEETPDTAYQLEDGTTVLKGDLPKGATVVNERPTSVKKWHWCKLLGGHDVPLDKREWLGKYLPIISVTGKEINVDGEVVRKGIVRDLKDPARMVNFSYSETVQTLALQNKVPYMASAEAIEGHEDIWQAANIETRAYLPFNAYDGNGNALPKPERQMPAVMPAAQVQLLQLSTEQMRAASGQQNANFGIKSEAASGVGIQRLKAQGEIATFHFPDNLARALRYEAKVLIDLIQNYYDSKRVVRILGLDGKEESAVLDPEMEQAYMEMDGQEDIQRIFNPLVGEYDVVIDTGPSYQTQRQEGAANLNDLAARNPQLMQIAGDLIMRAQDFPMADKLAERMAKTLPPELRDEKPGQQIDPAMQAQMQQLQQQLEQMAEALGKAGEHVDKLESDKEQAAVANEIAQQSVDVDKFRAETERMKLESTVDNDEAELAAKVEIERIKLEMERVKAESEERLKVIELTGAFPVEEKEPDNTIPNLILANIEAVQSLAASIAQPKQSQVRIVKQADGSFVGEKIEG